jgi:hypothetical protein
MDLLNVNALTQSAGRHVATLGHINVLDATLCDNVCQLLATGRWFSTSTLVFSTNKTHRHDQAEILLKVVLNTITVTIILVHYPDSELTRLYSYSLMQLILIYLYLVLSFTWDRVSE